MATINLTGFLSDPRTGKLNADAQADWPSGLVVDYRFSNGDQWVDKDGFNWASANRNIITAGGSRGSEYQYTGGNDPFGDGAATPEEYFTMPELGEFYFKRKIFIPANYRHREMLRLTLSNATGWQVGDQVYGLNAGSTAEIEYISGNNVCLKNAFNSNVAGYWNTTITNVTRSLTATGSGHGMWSGNNKFQTFYCDGYSSNGDSPTAVVQLWPNRFSDAVWGNGSTINMTVGVNNGPTRVVTQSPVVPFILPAHYGKWLEVIFYLKMASAVGVLDGISTIWRRAEGETNYTKIQDFRALESAERPTKGKFRAGYVWGHANSGYQDPTLFVESQTMLSTTPIDGVTF